MTVDGLLIAVLTVLTMYPTGCGGSSPTTFGHSVDSKYKTGTRVSGLESICSDWLKMFSKLNTTSVLSVPTKGLADVLL